MTVSSEPGDNLASRLNALFESTAGLHGRSASNNDVAAAIKAAHPEVRVSGAYLSALRSGTRTRPSMELLVALADHFGVSVLYFTEQKAAKPNEDAAELAARLNELGVRRIALRAIGLNEDSLSTVAAVLDHVRKLQGLPAIEGEDHHVETNTVESEPQ